MYRILTIAGSDSCGGAGIQADLKTISALGCYGMSAITAITAQNTSEISEVLALSPSLVLGQIRAVMGGVNAIKLGMLANEEIVHALCGELKKHSVPLVFDPVLQATSGAELFEGNPNCFQKLYPFADLITPNIPEAIKLTGISICSKQEMESAGQALLDLGAKAVLIKGGHLKEEATDCLIVKGEKSCWIEGNYIQTKNTHGTGCKLSSAIACHLAQGWSLRESVQLAKQYLEEELQR